MGCQVTEQLKRILVVDDDEGACSAMSRILTREGYDVVVAANGFEALNHLRNSSVDLIISDINMPEMNGMVFLRELKESHPGSNIIMITAYGEMETYMEAMNLGVFEYINKPVKIDELKKIICKALNGSNLNGIGGVI